MVTSIDGHLHPSRFTPAASGISADTLRRHYEEVAERFDADGWIVGRRTMSEMAKGRERTVADVPMSAREPNIANRHGLPSP